MLICVLALAEGNVIRVVRQGLGRAGSASRDFDLVDEASEPERRVLPISAHYTQGRLIRVAPSASFTHQNVQARPKKVATQQPQAFFALSPSASQPIARIAPFARSDAEPIETPKPYSHSFGSSDGNGTTQSRQESKDENGVVTGSYSYADPNGIFRVVEYIADKDGFRASIRTNEPGVGKTELGDPSGVLYQIDAAPLQ